MGTITFRDEVPATAVAAGGLGNGGSWIPSDSGMIAWTYDPAGAAQVNATLITGGSLYLMGVQVRAAATSTEAFMQQVAAGSSMTAGACFMGLINSSGTRVAVTADISGSFATANATLNPLWTSPVALVPGLYWIALLLNSTGTMPTFRLDMSANSASYGALINANLAPAQWRFANQGAGLTAIPASITPSLNSAPQIALWSAIA
jgi:hypothetical protein